MTKIENKYTTIFKYKNDNENEWHNIDERDSEADELKKWQDMPILHIIM